MNASISNTTTTYARINEELWRPQFDADQVFLLEPDLSNVTFDDQITGFKVDGSNKQQITQFGRALAIKFCNLWTLDAGEDLPPQTYLLNHSLNGRTLEASISNVTTKDGQTIKYAELWEKTDSDSEWHEHPMVRNTTRWTVINRVDKTKSITAFTKYHFLVKLMQGVQVTIINADTKTIDIMVDAFRREMWYLCGFDWKDYKQANDPSFESIPTAA